MVNNTVILIDNKLSKNTIEKVIKKHNINTIFFSSTYKEKVLEIIKNNNCNNFNLINFDSENQFRIIEYEKLINIGRYIENYSIDNLSKEENREKSTIIVSLAGEKKYSQQEFIESANVIAKTARIRKRKEMNAFHEKLKDYLRQYYYVGGMPEVVKHYVENKLLNQVRTIQNEILSNYAGDFSKHAPTQEVPRIDMVWQSILGQLSKENKKFVYGVLKKGGRAKVFELAIQWLIDAGLIYKTTKVTKPELPLKFYEDISAFKLYLCDCGLMGAMADTDAKNVLISDTVFTEYKGAFTEQYVLQQLLASNINNIYYYSSDTSRMEMDFIIQQKGALVPIEVKGGTSIKATSLHNYLKQHQDIPAVRFSMLPYRKQENITNMPLYGVFLSLE